MAGLWGFLKPLLESDELVICRCCRIFCRKKARKYRKNQRQDGGDSIDVGKSFCDLFVVFAAEIFFLWASKGQPSSFEGQNFGWAGIAEAVKGSHRDDFGAGEGDGSRRDRGDSPSAPTAINAGLDRDF